jgi:hypothetical protein
MRGPATVGRPAGPVVPQPRLILRGPYVPPGPVQQRSDLPTPTLFSVGPTALVSLALRSPADPPIAALPPLAAPAAGAAAQSGPPRPKAQPARHVQPEPSGKGSDERRPGAPSGPPGRTSVGAGTAPPAGGGASGLWCAILVGLAAYTAQQLRRHRRRFVLLKPIGFVTPQQRPG